MVFVTIPTGNEILMTISDNPFFTGQFEETWLQHFNDQKPGLRFGFIDGVHFYKPAKLPFYVNTGRNLTKGNHYEHHDVPDFKGKVFLIYDVPEYVTGDKVNHGPKGLKKYSVYQYPGFLIDLKQYTSFEDYKLKTFGRSSRMKFRKFAKRLEHSFPITTTMYYGVIDEAAHKSIFKTFKALLTKRFSDKQITNNNLNPEEWRFYEEVSFKLINEKKASLFVMFKDNTPIAITLNYHWGKTLIDAITVFDIDYTKFNLGYINNLRLIEWCFENNISKLDYSKGYFDYKKRISNRSYGFHYHILYDGNSPYSISLALLLKIYFRLKLFLREKKVNVLLHKLTFALTFKTRKANSKSGKTGYREFPVPEEIEAHKLDEANMREIPDLPVKQALYDFLYKNMEKEAEVELYKIKDNPDSLLFKGTKVKQLVKFE